MKKRKPTQDEMTQYLIAASVGAIGYGITYMLQEHGPMIIGPMLRGIRDDSANAIASQLAGRVETQQEEQS